MGITAIWIPGNHIDQLARLGGGDVDRRKHSRAHGKNHSASTRADEQANHVIGCATKPIWRLLAVWSSRQVRRMRW